MEAVKAMLHDQNLLKHPWVEAARTAVYVQNRTLHRVLGSKTTEEMFTGEKLEVSHLRIFSCPIYIHVPKEKRSKLDPSRKNGIFDGYSETLKAYKVYIPGHKQVEINIYVTFDEDVAFNNSRKCRTDEDHDEESVAPRVADMRNDIVLEEHDIVDYDMGEPQIPTYPLRGKKRPAWALRLYRMQKNTVLQKELIEKARNQNHIPVTWHSLVILLMQSLHVMKRLHKRRNGRMS
jgi:hypothetical protein